MARNFNGSTEKLLNTASAAITALPGTIAAWARTDVTNAELEIAGVSNSGDTTPVWRIGMTSTGKAMAHFRANAGIGGNKAIGSTTLSTTALQHIAGTFASNATTNVYLSGSSEGSNADEADTTITVTQTEIGVLQRATPAQFWDGDIAEVAMWNVVLDAAEIAALADGFSPFLIRPASLRFYADLVRGVNDRRGLVLTATGTTVVAHPRMIYPKKRQAWHVAAAAGGGAVGPLIGGKLMRRGVLLGGRLV